MGKGTGLGLSMVHGFAEQSGGRLQLSSTIGRGTSATIWLQATSQVASGAEGQPGRAPEVQRRLRVLAVDDDALVLMNTVAMLEDLGHEVFEAGSAHKALEVLRSRGRVDLVVTDQAMPKVNGSQLAEMIHQEWSDLPVILATGYSELPRGANPELPRLSKPFSQQELAAASRPRPRDCSDRGCKRLLHPGAPCLMLAAVVRAHMLRAKFFRRRAEAHGHAPERGAAGLSGACPAALAGEGYQPAARKELQILFLDAVARPPEAFPSKD